MRCTAGDTAACFTRLILVVASAQGIKYWSGSIKDIIDYNRFII